MTRVQDISLRLLNARRQLESIEQRDRVIEACTAGFERLEALLSRPPRVVVLGEANVGKTSVADLLLGVSLLPASVVANTRNPRVIRYADAVTLHAVDSEGNTSLTVEEDDALIAGASIERFEIGLPNARLKEFEIVDTPGLSAEFQGFAGDIFIWCTMATRAWTESERAKWEALPRRTRRNALLVATHEDALADPGDAAKIEWRLRATTGDMFRDVFIVSAVDPSPRPTDTPANAAAAEFIAQVSALSAGIHERRAAKVDRLARRLARLSLHHLGRGPLKGRETRIINDWYVDCERLIRRLDDESGELIGVLRMMLYRFAEAVEQASPGRIGRHGRWALPAGREPRRCSLAGRAARRYARLLAADLTSLVRAELSRSGLVDESFLASYSAAKAALLPVARLDEILDEVGAMLMADPASESHRDLHSSRHDARVAVSV